jgi:hypothetical protein
VLLDTLRLAGRQRVLCPGRKQFGIQTADGRRRRRGRPSSQYPFDRLVAMVAHHTSFLRRTIFHDFLASGG